MDHLPGMLGQRVKGKSPLWFKCWQSRWQSHWQQLHKKKKKKSDMAMKTKRKGNFGIVFCSAWGGWWFASKLCRARSCYFFGYWGIAS